MAGTTIGSKSSYDIGFYIFDPASSNNLSFETWASTCPVGSWIMHLGTGVLYIKLANQSGTITYYPFTGLNDNDVIDANYDNTGAVETNGIQLSDDRVKDYIEEVKLPLSSILKIPLRYFKYKEDVEDKLQIGTSAQSLQKICPELIHHNDEGYLMVDYSKLSLLALRAVKLQQDKIRKLEKTINTFDERLKKLEKDNVA